MGLSVQGAKNGKISSIAGQRVSLKPFPVARGGQVKFEIKDDVIPCKTPYFRIPIGLESIVDKKLDELEQMEIIEKVHEHSEWISPMIVVPKGQNDVRLVLDMRRPNLSIKRIHHTVPVLEDFLPRLKGSEYFSKIDIKNAFHHLELHRDSREITTFMTNRGLYRFTRLLFGVNCAPEIFQHYMEQVLRGIPNCFVMIDDILVYGKERQHDESLKRVLGAIKSNNLELNNTKCVTKVKEVNFLGFYITTTGSRPAKDKSEAVRSFREPKTAAEIESFLGLINFLGSYIEDLATKQKPLRNAAKRAKTEKFTWGKPERKAFEDLKEAVAKAPERTYFDNSAETILYTDASPVGLGAALIQLQKDGNGEIDDKTGKVKLIPKVIAFAAKTLTPTEQNYAQTQREALAIPWACEKFYIYLIGRHFRLLTDHQALAYLFSRKATTTRRVETLRANRWAVRVMGYDFTAEWCRGVDNIADVLSRLSQLSPIPFSDDGPHYVAAIENWNGMETVQSEEILKESKKCEEIKQVLEALQTNIWSKELRNYQAIQNELRNIEGMLCRENKVVIPKSLREKVLRISHEGHPGETAMKRDLRSKVWWPAMGRAVDVYVAACLECTAVSRQNPPEELLMTKLPTEAWEKIGIDFTTFNEHNIHLLVVVDYYSRYVELRSMTITDADRTIEALEDIFSTWGFPAMLVSDNGQPFASDKFKRYLEARGIIHDRTTPYTPNQNGEVERQNRGIKKCLKIAKLGKASWKRSLRNHIIAYNNRIHTTTGKAPSELMTGRKLRGRIIDLETLPNNGDDDWKLNDATNKLKAKIYADQRRKARPSLLKQNDLVMLQSQESGKLKPTFDPVKYRVLEKRGSEVLVQRDGNENSDPVLRRNVTQVMLWPKSVSIDQNKVSDRRSDPNRDHDEQNGEPTFTTGAKENEEEIVEETVQSREKSSTPDRQCGNPPETLQENLSEASNDGEIEDTEDIEREADVSKEPVRRSKRLKRSVSRYVQNVLDVGNEILNLTSQIIERKK